MNRYVRVVCAIALGLALTQVAWVAPVMGQATAQLRVVAFGGFLGLGSETHTLPWEQLHYDTTLHGYKTNITEEQLRRAPEFSRSDEALLSGHEQQQLSDYYMEPW